jgi:serine/threonine-protein kinase/endoribonuclease IRE1
MSVDIFSMGCVYFYVMSDGNHLFGSSLERQANILSGKHSNISLLSERPQESQNILAVELILDMIMKDPSKRPKAEAILKHPLFWREEKILGFFQDISDKIEKLDVNMDPLRTLERNAKAIIRDDWKQHLDENLKEDLRKHRDYLSISVRDLLRAIRNKRHHYHELSSDIQRLLGAIPIEFTRYWIVRFPRLLPHTYHAFSCCSTEVTFRRYYTPKFVFTKPDYLSDENYDNFELKELCENLRQLYCKTPKKENRQQQGKVLQEKSKRGSYNFPSNNVGNTQFITRDDMVTVNRGKKKTEKSQMEEKIVWTLPSDPKNQ